MWASSKFKNVQRLKRELPYIPDFDDWVIPEMPGTLVPTPFPKSGYPQTITTITTDTSTSPPIYESTSTSTVTLFEVSTSGTWR